MAADEIAVTSTGPMLGEIVSRGRLHGPRRPPRRRIPANDPRLARQPRDRGADRLGHRTAARARIRGTRTTPLGSPGRTRRPTIHRGVGLANMPTELTQIESPHFVDICSRQAADDVALRRPAVPSPARLAKARHAPGRARRDRSLVPPRHRHRRAQSPAAAALAFLSPPLRPARPTAAAHRPPAGSSISIAATSWQPTGKRSLADANDNNDNSRGLTARGEPANQPRFPRPPPGNRRPRRHPRPPLLPPRRLGQKDQRRRRPAPSQLTVEGDRIDIPIGPHQWIEVEVEFQPT